MSRALRSYIRPKSTGRVSGPLGRVLLTVVVVSFLIAQVPLAGAQTATETGHDSGEIGEAATGHGHSGALLHHVIETLQVVSGFTALVAVGLAARQFRGGSIEGPLYIIGSGVGVVAIHRLWHGISEVNMVPSLPSQGSQVLFLIGLLLLTVGFLLLWESLRVDA
jgi:hypothetical protein